MDLPREQGSDPPVTAAGYIWVVVMLLWPVALLNYLDRQMLAAMKSSIMIDIPSIALEAKWGLLLGCFKWVYAGLSPFGGMVADRFNRRMIIAGSLLVWSTVTWLTAYVQTYESMLWARALMGVSEACYIPAALALIADFHTRLTRSRAIGIHQTAIYAGLILGGFTGFEPRILTSVADDIQSGRYRGVVYAIPLFMLLRDAPKQPMLESQSPVRRMIRTPSRTWALLTNVSFLCWSRTLLCLPLLDGRQGLDASDSQVAILSRPRSRWRIGNVVCQPCGVGRRFFGRWLADAWMRKSVRGRINVSAIGMLLIVPALLGIGYAPSLLVAVLFLILFGIGWAFSTATTCPS